MNQDAAFGPDGAGMLQAEASESFWNISGGDVNCMVNRLVSCQTGDSAGAFHMSGYAVSGSLYGELTAGQEAVCRDAVRDCLDMAVVVSYKQYVNCICIFGRAYCAKGIAGKSGSIKIYEQVEILHLFANKTVTTNIYTLSLQDALPIRIGNYQS